MPEINVAGLEKAKATGRESLPTGPYEITITSDTKIHDRDNDGVKLSLQLSGMVIDGPVIVDQDTGEETPTEGRKTTDFFQLTGLNEHKDGGDYAKSRLKSICLAVGYDATDSFNTDDFIEAAVGETIIATNKLQKDKRQSELMGEMIMRENWVSYRAE